MAVRDVHPRELIEKVLEGGLDAAGARRLEAHLKACAGCRAEMKFARREREALARLAAGTILAPRDLARLEWSVIRAVLTRGAGRPGFGRRLIPTPVLAASAAAALLLLWFSGNVDRVARWRASGTAVGIAEVRDRRIFQRARQEALDRIVEASSSASLSAGRVGFVLADFEKAGDLAEIVVSGFVQPALKAEARSGRRCLHLSRLGTAEAPLLISLTVPAGFGCSPVTAVSVWVRAEGGPCEIALRGPGGEGTARRTVGPGPWTWVLFKAPPPDYPGETGLREVRLELTGPAAASLDLIELWCAGAGSGG